MLASYPADSSGAIAPSRGGVTELCELSVENSKIRALNESVARYGLVITVHATIDGNEGMTCFRISFFAMLLVIATIAVAEDPTPRIAWYGQLADGLAEAQRTGRPILLVSGAPQCHGVPGVW